MQQAARGAGIEFYLQGVEEGDFIVSPHPPPPPDDSLVHASVVSLLAECVLRTEGESAARVLAEHHELCITARDRIACAAEQWQRLRPDGQLPNGLPAVL